MDVLKRLFERHFRNSVERVEPLQGQLGASGRKIFRLFSGRQTAIGVLHDVREENVAFVEFSRHFRRHDLPVPEIYEQDLDEGAYIEEDFGDTTLFDFLSRSRTGESVGSEVIDAYRKVVAILPSFQVEAAKDLDYRVCYPRDSFDRQSIAWDLNYFKYYFLRLAGIPFNEQALENDFERLTLFLLTADQNYFLYRDFQSRNIMLKEGRPYFLDYQGGRQGALHYDIASLLYDSKADLAPALRQDLLDHYLDNLTNFIPLRREEFMRHYYAYVYVRIMQAMGAYGFRGFFERKTHFLQSVPYALKNVHWLLENAELPIQTPTLLAAFKTMLRSEKLQRIALDTPEQQKLIVRLFSFSFKHDTPKDDTDNRGGFVFDVRSLPNPGREERYKKLTGKDRAVMDYLTEHDAVHQYFAHVIGLVDASVANYQSRGFKDLMVSFGCTGGQHRSVYLTEQLARHLRAKSGVDVVIRHLGLERLGL